MVQLRKREAREWLLARCMQQVLDEQDVRLVGECVQLGMDHRVMRLAWYGIEFLLHKHKHKAKPTSHLQRPLALYFPPPLAESFFSDPSNAYESCRQKGEGERSQACRRGGETADCAAEGGEGGEGGGGAF